MSPLFSDYWKVRFPYLAPIDSPSGGNNTPQGGPSGSSKEDIIEFLGEDEPEPLELPEERPRKEKTTDEDAPEEEPSDEDEPSSEDEDEDEDEEETDDEDELSELEQELEGPTDDKLELVTPVSRREILKKYPNIFKDFPYLETAYYREQQFTEMYPTIQDARDASEKAGALDNFERDLVNGDTTTVLNAMKKDNPNSFKRIVDNYLTNLSKVDEGAYNHVIGNTVKHTIAAMVSEARRTNNENLQNAALLLNQFVFGTSEFKPPTNLASDTPQDNERDNAAQRERREFLQQRFSTTRTDLNARVNNRIQSTIAAHIDPKGTMTDYVKRTAIRDAQETLATLIKKDRRFANLTDRLWDHVFDKNFDSSAVGKVESAYFAKAKTLLPAIIKKARIDALKGMGVKVRKAKGDTDTQDEPRPGSKNKARNTEKPSSQREGQRRSGKVKSAKDIPAGMSSLEFLMQDD